VNQIEEQFADFRAAYCHLRGIEPEKFERKVLKEVMFPHARIALFWARILNADAFHAEESLVRQAGSKVSLEEVKSDIDFYQHKSVVGSFVRGTLKFRVSGIRLQRLTRETFKNLANSPVAPW
jgi:hypothetical protein